MPPCVVQHLERRLGGALVPAAVGGADAGAVELEAEADRLGGLRLHEAGAQARRRERAAGREPLQHVAPPGRTDPVRHRSLRCRVRRRAPASPARSMWGGRGKVHGISRRLQPAAELAAVGSAGGGGREQPEAEDGVADHQRGHRQVRAQRRRTGEAEAEDDGDEMAAEDQRELGVPDRLRPRRGRRGSRTRPSARAGRGGCQPRSSGSLRAATA